MTTAEAEATACAKRIEELKAEGRQAEEDALQINQACELAQRSLDAKSAELQQITKEFEQVWDTLMKHGSNLEVPHSQLIKFSFYNEFK